MRVKKADQYFTAQAITLKDGTRLVEICGNKIRTNLPFYGLEGKLHDASRAAEFSGFQIQASGKYGYKDVPLFYVLRQGGHDEVNPVPRSDFVRFINF